MTPTPKEHASAKVLILHILARWVTEIALASGHLQTNP
jgi:hypothetical protein